MINKNIKAIPIDVNNKFGKQVRYLIVDIETGEILDDANGYGFKTDVSAYKSFSYKLKHST